MIEFSEPKKETIELSSLSLPGIHLTNAENIFFENVRSFITGENLEEFIGQPVFCTDNEFSYGIIKLKNYKKKKKGEKYMYEYELDIIDRFEDPKPVSKSNKLISPNVNFLQQEDEDIEDVIEFLDDFEELAQKTFTPPESVKNNAKKVLEWKKKYSSEVKGMTSVGWARARQLASGKPIGIETIKKMSRFNRHRKNATVDPKFKSEPWKDRGRVAWLGWGGSTGINWAIGILKGLKGGKENG